MKQGMYTSRSETQNRTVLADVIPLDTPYAFGFFIGDVCNFRCKYCIQSVAQGAEGALNEHKGVEQLVRHFMSWETFLRAAEQLKRFPQRLKKVLFSSIGEPLLHPRLPEMIAYLRDCDAATDYELVTNASLLTPELSRALIEAGLTRLCVSVQGMTEEKYKSICDYTVDMKRFVENLHYFFEYGRGKCRLHIKTVDIALAEGEEKVFLSVFGKISDTIHVDHVFPVYQDVDYYFLEDQAHGLFTEKQRSVGVCSLLFYTLYMNPNGEIIPCCIVPYPLSYGNIHHDDLVSVWNGSRRRTFLMMHLKEKRYAHPVCRACVHPDATVFSEDCLDGAVENILKRMNKM